MNKIKRIAVLIAVSVCLLLCSCLIIGCGDDSDGNGLKYTRDPSGGYIVSGVGTDVGTDIVIPATYKGSPVVGIGDGAFGGWIISQVSRYRPA